MDVLSDLLQSIRLNGAVYFQHAFTAPWGMHMPSSSVAHFHIVVEGACWLQTEDERVRLTAGDVVLLLQGDTHRIADSLETACVSGDRVLQAYQNDEQLFQGDAVDTVLICGHFEFERSMDHPLVRSLPPVLRLPDEDIPPTVANTLNMIMKEMEQTEMGSAVVVNRLAEILFIHVIRAYVQQQGHPKGFLAALRDVEISKALGFIHANPQYTWTLAELAQAIGLSRAAFAKRFHELVGMPPMQYITAWRMQKAYELLMGTNLPLAAISEKVGYRSEAAFHRAFTRHFAHKPGALRRTS